MSIVSYYKTVYKNKRGIQRKGMVSAMDKKTIVVVGAGKGMGNHIAEEFGKNDFRIVLMARKQESLSGKLKNT